LIGIWAQGDLTDDMVRYRWEADEQSGFVTFEVATQQIRPAEASGQPIVHAYRRRGSAPPTAHAYY
jgi:hypothetical protein